MSKICDMLDVREHCENYAVELHRNDANGRLVVRAFNEGHNNITEVDLFDLLGWLARGPGHHQIGMELSVPLVSPHSAERGSNGEDSARN